jgi:hypothetical protein
MKDKSPRKIPQSGFDLVRVSKAKETVDLAPNTIYNLARQNLLRIYRQGRSSWFSKSELEAVLKAA